MLHKYNISRALDNGAFLRYILEYSPFLNQTYHVTTQKKRLAEALLLNGHMIRFGGEIRKIFQNIS